MTKIFFDWDDENLAHILRHKVTSEEAEAVVLNRRNDINRSRSSGHPITFGRTKTGKFLAVVWI